MARGTVKWFDPKKGFGFVVNEDDDDVFVHYTNIQCDGFRCLKKGQEVVFEQTRGDNGLCGVNVRILHTDQPCAASEDETETV